jgi:hypothetical protein
MVFMRMCRNDSEHFIEHLNPPLVEEISPEEEIPIFIQSILTWPTASSLHQTSKYAYPRVGRTSGYSAIPTRLSPDSARVENFLMEERRLNEGLKKFIRFSMFVLNFRIAECTLFPPNPLTM